MRRADVAAAARRLAALTIALAARRRPVLAALVVANWVGVAAFALTVRHNGWVFYQGGDQIWSTTSAALLADGTLPPTEVGVGWVLALVPLAWFVASDYVAFMPGIIALNVLLLGPLALFSIYELARRIGGNVLALAAGALWVVAPYLAIPLFRSDYHERYVEQFLPGALGLTGLADFPSLVCLLLAALLFVRALDCGDAASLALAGVATGIAVAVKPSNVLFLLGPALALVAARRLRAFLPYALGVLPGVLLLTFWKVRGLGDLPLFALPEASVALGGIAAAPSVDVGRYVDLDWANFRHNMANLREYFYSARVVQWIPFAGAFAVARKSLPLAALLAGWLAAFIVIKGTAPQSTVESGTFFRLLIPAYPAYFLLFVALPLLVPGVVRRLPAVEDRRPLPRRALALLVLVGVAVPSAAIAVSEPIRRDSPDAVTVNTILVPVDDTIAVRVEADGRARTLRWRHRNFGRTSVFYRVYRTEAGGRDVDCLASASPRCDLEMIQLTSTRARSYVDLSPPAGALYRVAVAANSKDDVRAGDAISISRPVPADP